MHIISDLRRIAGFATSVLLALAALPADAQGPAPAARAWNPDRTVTLIVPYAAGGGTDAMARAVARGLAAVWNQAVVVENIPGADGLIGTRRAIEAKPDGHTIVLQLPSVTLAVHDPASKGFDPVDHIEPVTAVAEAWSAFISSPKITARTMQELIQYCKTAPAPCSFATAEKSAKLIARKFAHETGISNLIVVNYKGAGPIIPDLMAGTVTMAFTSIGSALPFYKAGNVRLLSTLGARRSPLLPEVQTIREAGLPDFETVTWYGLFAPKGTPKAITESIAAAWREASKDPDVQRVIQAAGATPALQTPDEFRKQVDIQRTRYSALAKQFPLMD